MKTGYGVWRRPKPGQVWLGILPAVVLAVVVSQLYWPVIYWMRRSEYDRNYSKYLNLPPNVGSIFAKTANYGYRPGIQLSVDVYRPDASGDQELRDWIAFHNGLTPWVSTLPKTLAPMGEWSAFRDKYTYSFQRMDDRGWIHFWVSQLVPDYGLERAKAKPHGTGKK